jgi:hypothetical protein
LSVGPCLSTRKTDRWPGGGETNLGQGERSVPTPNPPKGTLNRNEVRPAAQYITMDRPPRRQNHQAITGIVASGAPIRPTAPACAVSRVIR